MTLKEIWAEFCESVKESAVSCWESIKKVCKSTLELLKTTLITFVGGIFNWIKDLACGVASVVWELIKIVWSALVTALASTIGLLYEAIVNWIKKW